MKVSASSKKIDPDTIALNNGLSMAPNTGNDQSHKQRNRYRRVFDDNYRKADMICPNNIEFIPWIKGNI